MTDKNDSVKNPTSSRCSQGEPLTFRWFGFPTAEPGQDLQVLLSKVEEVIHKPNRIINDYVLGMAKAEIRTRIRLAEKGALHTPSQVDSVDRRGGAPLYEIRWQNITVLVKRGRGKPRESEIKLRLYHSEPREAPSHFVGHHIHEKDLTVKSQINHLQNAEIRVARNYYFQGLPTFWGIRN